MTGLRKLPIGIQDFESLKMDGYLYVDKTEQIYRLISTGRYYFLSRPRRFGKSLLLSTIKCIFEGKRELFDGLAIRADRQINLCEIKFSKTRYTITGEYYDRVRDRKLLFGEIDASSKGLISTFVTTYGVAEGIYKGIVDNEVVAEQLFA